MCLLHLSRGAGDKEVGGDMFEEHGEKAVWSEASDDDPGQDDHRGDLGFSDEDSFGSQLSGAHISDSLLPHNN